MIIQDRFKRWFKFRFAVLYPFGVGVLFFATPDDRSIRMGIGFILMGLFLRVWANGYAIKLEKLTTSGPYAFVRHPLYLGTMLLVVGFVIMLKVYFIGIAFLVLFMSIYFKTIRKEESMLENKFGEVYLQYKNKVPSMLPTIFPYRAGERWSFSMERLIKSQEYKLFIWIIVLVITFYLKGEFIAEKETMDAKMWQLLIFAICLGVVDLVGEYIKWLRRRA